MGDTSTQTRSCNGPLNDHLNEMRLQPPFTVSVLGYPVSTPEPLVLLTPPRCLTANRTQQGVLLTWLPPANHSSPIGRYIIEFRLGERWEVLDDLIPATETEIIARDLIQVILTTLISLLHTFVW